MHILDFWVRGIPQPSGAAILNSGVPEALNLRFGRKNEIMRMISIFQKIVNSGATAVHAHPLTFYAPPRDSIAIPAFLMRGDIDPMLLLVDPPPPPPPLSIMILSTIFETGSKFDWCWRSH